MNKQGGMTWKVIGFVIALAFAWMMIPMVSNYLTASGESLDKANQCAQFGGVCASCSAEFKISSLAECPSGLRCCDKQEMREETGAFKRVELSAILNKIKNCNAGSEGRRRICNDLYNYLAGRLKGSTVLRVQSDGIIQVLKGGAKVNQKSVVSKTNIERVLIADMNKKIATGDENEVESARADITVRKGSLIGDIKFQRPPQYDGDDPNTYPNLKFKKIHAKNNELYFMFQIDSNDS